MAKLQNATISATLGREKKDGTHPLLIKVYYNGKKKYVGTGFDLRADQWNTKRSMVVNHPNASDINLLVSQMITKFQQREIELMKGDGYCTDDIIRCEEQPKNFIEFCLQDIKHRDISYKHNNRFTNTIKDLQDFAGGNVRFSQLTHNFVRDFDLYLKKKNYHTNTICYRHQTLKTLILSAIRQELMENKKNPYEGFPIKRLKTERYVPSLDEISAMWKMDCGEDINLDHVRNMFLFCCYTGIRFEDMQALTPKNFTYLSNGDVFMNLREMKTGKLIENFPLNIAFKGNGLTILNRYYNQDNARVFPTFTNEAVNRILKTISGIIHTGKPLTFHMSRHAFGTYLYSVTKDALLVKNCMNHSKMETTMRYVHSNTEKRKEEFSKFNW